MINLCNFSLLECGDNRFCMAAKTELKYMTQKNEKSDSCRCHFGNRT